jgi:hypothetical protein
MRAAFLVMMLAGCATVPRDGTVPSSAAIARALDEWNFCLPDQFTHCPHPPEREVHVLRCRPADGPNPPSRVLCRFSGELLRPAGRRTAFGPDCAWLRHRGSGVWIIESFPDADLCEF